MSGSLHINGATRAAPLHAALGGTRQSKRQKATKFTSQARNGSEGSPETSPAEQRQPWSALAGCGGPSFPLGVVSGREGLGRMKEIALV